MSYLVAVSLALLFGSFAVCFAQIGQLIEYWPKMPAAKLLSLVIVLFLSCVFCAGISGALTLAILIAMTG